MDILTSIEGVNFADAWASRTATEFGGVSSHVISRRHLVVNKRALGRPQDLLDVSNLLESERVLGDPSEQQDEPGQDAS